MSAPPPPALAATLAIVGTAMAAAERDWWIIGSAAVILLGYATDARDVDVLLAQADAARVLVPLGLPLSAGTPDDRFRSPVFARWPGAAMPVDFMAGLQLLDGTVWQAVTPVTRVPHALAGGRCVYTPDRTELAGIFQRFGRPKDRLRAELLLAG